MDSNFALGIGVRAALLGVTSFVLLELGIGQQLYATALVGAGVAALLLLDLGRHVARADRLLERFVDGLAALDFQPTENLTNQGRSFRRLAAAIERAKSGLERARAARQHEVDRLSSLLDTIEVAVFLVAADDTISPANRAAHRLSRRPIRRLEEIRFVDGPLAESLLGIAPGQRRVLRLANGQRVLAAAARFSAAGQSLRFLSLQNIEGELDTVELDAWQALVRILAHEIMNSLTPISSLASSVRPLLDTVFAEAAAGRPSSVLADVSIAVDTIGRRSEGLMSFVQRYRRVAEVPRPERSSLSLAELNTRVERLLRPTLAARNIRWTRRVQPPDLRIDADGELLEQALINLVRNAIDAVADVPEPHVILDCAMRDDGPTISVTDNGHGFDPAAIDRLFVPFYTTKPGGTGIGLSLARQISRAHGGRLEAARAEPRGAVFTLVL